MIDVVMGGTAARRRSRGPRSDDDSLGCRRDAKTNKPGDVIRRFRCVSAETVDIIIVPHDAVWSDDDDPGGGRRRAYNVKVRVARGALCAAACVKEPRGSTYLRDGDQVAHVIAARRSNVFASARCESVPPSSSTRTSSGGVTGTTRWRSGPGPTRALDEVRHAPGRVRWRRRRATPAADRPRKCGRSFLRAYGPRTPRARRNGAPRRSARPERHRLLFPSRRDLRPTTKKRRGGSPTHLRASLT